MSLFSQSNFIAGLDTELDSTKTPKDSYSLLINGRARRDIIEPTRKHLALAAPDGNYQGLYISGDILVLFVSGVAYYADITQDPINFQTLAGWTAMDANVSRLYAEVVPATSNLFNRNGTPDGTSRVYNNTIAAFTQALFVFEGVATDIPPVNRPQAIAPDGTVITLADYGAWTKDIPQYVPFGVLPCVAANKLFLVSTDRKSIFQSVSGRTSDFVVNIDSLGEKAGEADTVSVTVSYNDITALRALSTGQVLVSTLYATFVLELDYTHTIFGEPYANPIYLFPVGAINELSSVDILEDTAFITQSGIHAFNAVAQAKRESNNFPLGAKIRGLLLNPQSDTCAINHDDYGFFAVNTIFGYGSLVYDTIRRTWTSLDLSFGHVKQFANTRIDGQERLFFITHENEIFEAFAGSAVNTTRVYLGEWTPPEADSQSLTYMVDVVFLNVKSAGQVKYTLYADGAKHSEVVIEVPAPGYTDSPPLPTPFTSAEKSFPIGWQFTNKARAWNVGVMVEWNFNGQLSELSIDGEVLTAENVGMSIQESVEPEEFAFVGNTGYQELLDPSSNFEDGFICVEVIKGHVYEYQGSGRLVSGALVIDREGIFTAPASTVAVEGSGATNFALRDITNFKSVLAAIQANKNISRIIGGGNHAYPLATLRDCQLGVLPFRVPYSLGVGDIDYGADLGSQYFNFLHIPRYRKESFNYVDVFFYNGGWTAANAILVNGVPTGATSEPDGNDVSSAQAAWLRQELSRSTKPFKLVVIAEPPYSNEALNYPGYTALRLPFQKWGASAVLSGRPGVMERLSVSGFPYLSAGVGGHSLGSFQPSTESAYRNADEYGFLHIKADPVTCELTFKNTANAILDSFLLYA